jgi:hypothetical protein
MVKIESEIKRETSEERMYEPVGITSFIRAWVWRCRFVATFIFVCLEMKRDDSYHIAQLAAFSWHLIELVRVGR